MLTLLITGNDTDCGKTWVTRALVEAFEAASVKSIQVVKPVETGVGPAGPQDAPFAAEGVPVLSTTSVTDHTLVQYMEAIAPVDAARAQSEAFCWRTAAKDVLSLPSVEVRLVEGAGGVAVPLNEPASKDWLDFALSIQADYVILVVENRLGAINQGRLLARYTKGRRIQAGFILNEIDLQRVPVAASNALAFEQMELPLWAEVLPGGQLRWHQSCPFAPSFASCP
jgi:dethiobiotin synthetase